MSLMTFSDPAMHLNDNTQVSDRNLIIRTYHRNDTNDKTVIPNEASQYSLSKNKPESLNKRTSSEHKHIVSLSKLN